MSADVQDLTGDKTMNANTNVKLTNGNVRWTRSTGAPRALTEGNGAVEMYRRPHAPRSGKAKNAALIGLHFDISLTSELRISVTHRSRLSDCAHSSLRPLDLIRASYRRRIGAHRSTSSARITARFGAGTHLAFESPAASIVGRLPQLAPACGPLQTEIQPWSKRRADSAQTNSITGRFHGQFIGATSQLSNLRPRRRMFRSNLPRT
jgi:hypothetical protein